MIKADGAEVKDARDLKSLATFESFFFFGKTARAFRSWCALQAPSPFPNAICRTRFRFSASARHSARRALEVVAGVPSAPPLPSTPIPIVGLPVIGIAHIVRRAGDTLSG